MSQDELDNPTSPAEEEAELPRWMSRALESAAVVPGAARHISLWLPTLSAAWSAGRRGMTLAKALRDGLEEGEPLEWPDELAADFTATVGELGEVLPGLEEALPSLAGLVDAGEQLVDPELAKSLVIDVLAQAEKIGEKLVTRLVDAAFFTANVGDSARRTRDLRQLFLRLEKLFDRALEAWVFQQDDQEARQ